MLFWCITHAVEQALSKGTVEAKIARYFLIRALGAGGRGGSCPPPPPPPPPPLFWCITAIIADMRTRTRTTGTSTRACRRAAAPSILYVDSCSFVIVQCLTLDSNSDLH